MPRSKNVRKKVHKRANHFLTRAMKRVGLRKVRRRQALLALAQDQAILVKGKAIITGKGRNGMSMSPELLAKHGLKAKSQD